MRFISLSEDVLLEESDESLARCFNGSTVVVGRDVELGGVRFERGRVLGELSPEERLVIVGVCRSLVQGEFKSFVKYLVLQVARGFMSLFDLRNDALIFNRTLDGFVRFSRKAAWGERSRNIYDYKNWRALKDEVVDFGDTNKDYSAVEGSVIVGQGEVDGFKYWLRLVKSIMGAYKYGRGTQWCTASDPVQYDGRVRECPAAGYLFSAELHSQLMEGGGLGLDSLGDMDLLIIEVQQPGGARKPIIQISPTGGEYDNGDGEMRGVQDQAVRRFGPRLNKFITFVLSGKMGNPDLLQAESVQFLATVIGLKKYRKPQPLAGHSFILSGVRGFEDEIVSEGGRVLGSVHKSLDPMSGCVVVSDKFFAKLMAAVLALDGEVDALSEFPSAKVAAAWAQGLPVAEGSEFVSNLRSDTKGLANGLFEPDDYVELGMVMYPGRGQVFEQ